MKKDKKMMAMYHRVNAIMQKSDELSRKLSLKIVEECTGDESAMVALYALAKTVFDVVDAQMAAGHKDAMEKFNPGQGDDGEFKEIRKKIKDKVCKL